MKFKFNHLFFLSILLFSSCASNNHNRNIASLSSIFGKCTTLFKNFFDSNQFNEKKFPEHAQKKELVKFFAELPEAIKNNIPKKLIKRMEIDFNQIGNPFHIISSFRESNLIKTDDDIYLELLDFYKIVILDSGQDNLNSWVKSNYHAIFVYHHFHQTDLETHWDDLQYLIKNNPFFSDALVLNQNTKSLVTFSFEKEDSTKDITLYYKHPHYTDEDWLDLTEDQRLDHLVSRVANRRLMFLNSDIIAPTEFHPLYIGGFSQEFINDNSQGFSWEISHKLFEISRKKIVSIVKEIGKFTKNMHSFHLHIVFELPIKYKFLYKFLSWHKYQNDYLYLKGMEEGLFETVFTKIATFLDISSISEVSNQNLKYYTMGIRGDIYGQATQDDMKKIGLELRDSSRNIETLNKHFIETSDVVQQLEWEKMPFDSDWRFYTPLLGNIKREEVLALRQAIPIELIDRLVRIESNIVIPLIDFEEGRFLKKATGGVWTWMGVTEEKRLAIIKARNEYLEQIKNIKLDIEKNEINGEKVDDSIIKDVIRLNLMNWAKEAKVSELFHLN